MRVIVFTAFVIFSLINALFADNSKGLELFKKKNYNQAYFEFKQSSDQNLSDLKSIYYLGLSATKIGDFDSAMAAYERLLILDESNDRARLELAKLYLFKGRNDEAVSLFKQVLSHNPPPKVRKNIEILLAKIEAKEKKSFISLYVSANVGYDSNPGAYPGDQVLIDFFSDEYGVPKEGVGIENESGSSGYALESAYLTHIYDIGEKDGLFLESRLYGLNQNYFSASDYDITYFNLYSGLGYLKDNMRFYFPIGYDKVMYGRDALLDTFSFSLMSDYYIKNSAILSMTLKYQGKRYDKQIDKGRDSNTLALGLSAQKAFGANIATLDFNYFNENKDSVKEADFVDRDIYEIGVYVRRNLTKKFDGILGYSYRNYDYDDSISEHILSSREDKQHSVSAKLSYEIKKDIYADLSYNYVKQDSNYEPAEYDKNVVMFGVSANFY